ncbi:MAG TPA: GTP 3',8-cyclase MoaA, partial [Bacteroidota bacterium]|nr:GTP 3',8-cyclase MoaA [Bacteroidota bacterium]
WLKKSELLTFEELARLVTLFAELGITKLRLTGGEPLMRKELHVLVENLSHINGIQDLALTTNGFFLADQAYNLYKAGLRRINISLDSLDPETFNDMTRRKYFDQVWAGIEAVERLGIRPIKLNVVLIRGVNDDQIVAFAEMTRTRPFVVRFIEFMPIGADDGWSMDKVIPTKEVIRRIERGIGKKLVALEYHGTQAADRYVFEDGLGEVGFISSVSEPFCDHCDRIRITSDGKLRTCLFSLVETDLKKLLRDGAGDEELKRRVIRAVQEKEEGHLINQPGFVRPERTMSQIGG